MGKSPTLLVHLRSYLLCDLEQFSKVMLFLRCFCFTTLSDWSKKLAPLSQPISKTKTKGDLLARVLPRLTLIIPNRTFLVRFGGISGEFGRAMVRILARRSRAKIPMVRPNELDMLPKRIKKGAIRYLPYPNSS